jgi:hypothetical protein
MIGTNVKLINSMISVDDDPDKVVHMHALPENLPPRFRSQIDAS